MARTVLLIGAIAWLLAGAGAFTLAAVGTQQLLSVLPPLAIDAAALGGALTALALTLVATGTAHLFVVAGLRDGRRWAASAGTLLASVMAAVSVGLAAAAISSALREPSVRAAARRSGRGGGLPPRSATRSRRSRWRVELGSGSVS